MPVDGATARTDPPVDQGPVDRPTGTGETVEVTDGFSSASQDAAPELTGPAPAQATRPPRFLGEYEVIAELARGGMGVVYRARQVKLDRIVALKLVRDPGLATYADLRRFQIEAEAVAQLDHPNIVPIYEVGQAEDQPYFSMKLIEGGNLSGNIERLRHHPRDVARLMVKVARAVHYAHQRAILHRDLKPSNILVGGHDEPFVTDFGLAKRIEPGAASAETATEAVMGTPAYMPPEQARGGTKSVTTAADVYSLGATLYEALTGRPPFAASSTPEILRKVLDEEPPSPRSLNPGVDRDLATICLKCLEKEPSRRFASAELLAEDLERWLDGRPITARPVSTRERAVKWVRRKPALAGLLAFSAAALVGLIGMGLYYNRNLERALDLANRDRYSADMNLARRAWDDREVYRAREYLEKYRDHASGLDAYRSFEWYYLWKLCDYRLVSLSGHAGNVLSVAYSPDGQRLASGSSDMTVRLWDLERNRTEFLLRGHKGDILALAFRPDGKILASGSVDGTVRLWDVMTGECRQTLQVGRRVNCIDFSPDGKTIALTTDIEDRVYFWDVASSREQFSLSSATVDVDRPSFSIWNIVKYSRDGSRVFILDNADNGVAVWDIADRRLTRIPHGMIVRGLSLSGDGRWLVTLNSSSMISVWDAVTLSKAEFPHLGGSGGSGNCQVACASSPQGELLAYASATRISGLINLWNLDSRRRIDTIMTEMNPFGQQCLAFRPDGRRLAIAHKDQIVIVTVMTLEQSQTLVSAPGAQINALAVRGDGERLAWVAHGDPRVVVWDPGLGKPIRSLAGHEIGVRALAYGPPARPDLLASAGADGKVRLWDSDRDGPARLTLSGHVGEVQDVGFLPDGRGVVSAGVDGTVRVWDADTGRKIRDLRGDAGPLQALAVAPDGRRVAAACGAGLVLVWNVDTGRRVLGPLFFDGVANDVAFSPDGSRLSAAGSTNDMAFSANGSRPSGTGSNGGSRGAVVVWDTASGSVVSRSSPPGIVRSLVFSSDGRRVVTGGNDGPLVVWDAVTGRETIALDGHKKPVFALVAAPGQSDDKIVGRIYSAGSDGTVRLWEGLDPGPTAAAPTQPDQGDVIRRPVRSRQYFSTTSPPLRVVICCQTPTFALRLIV